MIILNKIAAPAFVRDAGDFTAQSHIRPPEPQAGTEKRRKERLLVFSSLFWRDTGAYINPLRQRTCAPALLYEDGIRHIVGVVASRHLGLSRNRGLARAESM